ncbi:MAG TPA: aldehyde dehydrogenase family protein [Steroidobacteraceae bacterium]
MCPSGFFICRRLRAGLHRPSRSGRTYATDEINAGAGSVNVREVPGYRLELTPFGGIKDSGIGVKEGVQEAMKSFTNVKTYSLPW